jgi:hypothetical protein
VLQFCRAHRNSGRDRKEPQPEHEDKEGICADNGRNCADRPPETEATAQIGTESPESFADADSLTRRARSPAPDPAQAQSHTPSQDQAHTARGPAGPEGAPPGSGGLGGGSGGLPSADLPDAGTGGAGPAGVGLASRILADARDEQRGTVRRRTHNRGMVGVGGGSALSRESAKDVEAKRRLLAAQAEELRRQGGGT